MDKKEIKFFQRLISMGIDFCTLCVIMILFNLIALVLKREEQIYFMNFEFTFLFTLWLCKDLINGRSLGKRMVGHKLSSINDSNIIWKYIARNIFILIWPIEIIFCMINPSRRLGDLVFGTQITYVEKQEFKPKTIYFSTIIFNIIITFLIVLVIVLTIWYLIQRLNNPMIKLLLDY